jgi:hypothetical protein
MSSKLYLRPCDEPASLNMLHHHSTMFSLEKDDILVHSFSFSPTTIASFSPPFSNPSLVCPSTCLPLSQDVQRLRAPQSGACGAGGETLRVTGKGASPVSVDPVALATQPAFNAVVAMSAGLRQGMERCHALKTLVPAQRHKTLLRQRRRLIGRCAAGIPTAQQSHDDRRRAPSAHLPHLRAHWGGSVEQKRYSGGRDARY